MVPKVEILSMREKLKKHNSSFLYTVLKKEWVEYIENLFISLSRFFTIDLDAP